jgi:hypothetical protein
VTLLPPKPRPDREKPPIGEWNGTRIGTGEGKDLALDVGESTSGMAVRIPLHVRRGPEDGPVVFVSGALHGDEINGTGTIRAHPAGASRSSLRAGARSCSSRS